MEKKYIIAKALELEVNQKTSGYPVYVCMDQLGVATV
jgi:hypothetical protein